MTQHTPGPWNVTEPDRFYNGEVIKNDSGDWIAVVSDFNRYDRDAERQANAALIAAAPELYEYALIQESKDQGKPSPWHDCKWCDNCCNRLVAMRKSAIAKAEATK